MAILRSKELHETFRGSLKRDLKDCQSTGHQLFHCLEDHLCVDEGKVIWQRFQAFLATATDRILSENANSSEPGQPIIT